MAAGSLAKVLKVFEDMFPAERYPELIVGLDVSDDAAVYRVNGDRAIIFTLDFFTPVVDDPYTYGAIAAANAMSDVYAMGGQVAIALNICGFPKDFPPEVITLIFRGGAEKVKEAGGILAGGHTVDDKEPKYGLAVVGFVHPDKVLTKQGAKPGDAIILTKPLGVGIITTALKGEKATDEHVAGAVRSMLHLNMAACGLIQYVGVNACTDVSGFALLGHAADLASKSKVGMKLHLDKIPFLPGADEYAEACLFPGGTCKNEEAYSIDVRFSPGIPEAKRELLFTPETSGGLLVSVPGERIGKLLSEFKSAGEDVWVIGEVVEGKGIEVAG
jgi:selenide,water dikinase